MGDRNSDERGEGVAECFGCWGNSTISDVGYLTLLIILILLLYKCLRACPTVSREKNRKAVKINP